jgi:hypothetical protein
MDGNVSVEMNETKKLRDTTAVIALLAETFPKCFSVYQGAPPPAEAQDPSRYPGSPRRCHHARRVSTRHLVLTARTKST